MQVRDGLNMKILNSFEGKQCALCGDPCYMVYDPSDIEDPPHCLITAKVDGQFVPLHVLCHSALQILPFELLILSILGRSFDNKYVNHVEHQRKTLYIDMAHKVRVFHQNYHNKYNDD